jgi:hypothetical protein
MVNSTSDQEQVVVQRDGVDVEAEQLQALAQVQTENLDRVDLANALGAVGQVHGVVQVVQEDADDFAEAQRHDGQVVATQLERGRPEQSPKERRQHRRQRNHQPQRGVQALGEHGGKRRKVVSQVRRSHQAKQVGAHGVEGHVAQVEQARVAHHDVQAQGQHHVQQRQVGNAHPGVAEVLQDQREDQQRHGAQDPVDFGVLHGVRLLRRDRPHAHPAGPRGAA